MSLTLKVPEGLPPAYSVRMEQAIQSGCYEESQLTWVFNQILLSLYRDLYKDKSLKDRDIVVYGYVAPDGLGDYYQLLATAAILNHHFGARVKIIAKVQNLAGRIGKLTIPDSTKFQTFIYDANEFDTTEERKETEEAIRKAEILVVTPHEHSFGGVGAIKVFEYDFPKDGKNEPESGPSFAWERLTMGLGPYTLGITLKDPDEIGGLNSLENQELKELLLPSSETHHLIYGYLKTKNHKLGTGSDVFAYEFIRSCTLALKEDEKSIDFISPLDKINKKYFSGILLQSGVQKVELLKKGEDGALRTVEEFQISETPGKVVRLINPFPLSNHDAQILTKASYRYVGCTGDMSLSEALSFGKFPWYQMMTHKKRLYYALTGLSEGDLKPFFELIPNVTDREFSDPEEPGAYMGDPKVLDEMTKLSEKVKAHHNFNEVLVDLVYQKFANEEFWALKSIELELRNQFLNKEKSLSDCYTAFKEKVFALSKQST